MSEQSVVMATFLQTQTVARPTEQYFGKKLILFMGRLMDIVKRHLSSIKKREELN